MANTQSGYADVNGGRLYYEVAGEGAPLVLSHAGFVDSGMWDKQWDAFSRYYRTIRYDMRGFGRSDVVNGSVNRRDDLAKLLDHLDVDTAYLLGCSLSGEVIIDFALEQPERVRALIAVSAVPGGFEMRGEPPPHLLDMIAAAQQGDLERASDLQIRIWVDGMFRQPGDVDVTVREHAAAMNKIALRNGTWAADTQPLNPLDPPAVTRLKEIHVPLLVIDGALDHPEILRAANVMVNGIDGAQKVVIENAAHVPNMEQAERFNAEVLNFLNRL